MKLAQEISYIYGYHDLWNNQDELTEEAKNTLILYLGIMLGVTSAGSVVRILSKRLSIQAVKKIPQKALMKTFYYPILKKILAIFGAKLTKSTFAKGVSKAIPVLGGVVSGGINYASMKPMAMRLKDELSKNIGYTQEDAEKDLEILEADFEVISEQPETETAKHADDIFSKLERAHALFEKKILTEAEYIKLKETIIQEG